jgi:phosphoribosylformylglycinamidine synthase I
MAKKAKVLVLRTAGTNCDQELGFSFQYFGAEVDYVHINQLFAKKVILADYHILAIPGGFTYGDDIISGRILANELKLRLGKDIQQFIDDQKLIIGICNGFQVLVRAGILPGEMKGDAIWTPDTAQTATLTYNDSAKFEDRWTHLKKSGKSVWTQGLPEVVYIPVAHAEGKFLTESPKLLAALKKNGQVAFRYCTADGGNPAYPANPNGSVEHITGITDRTGRILGMMPHPERHFLFRQHPFWTRLEKKTELGDGAKIFENGVTYVKEKLLSRTSACMISGPVCQSTNSPNGGDRMKKTMTYKKSGVDIDAGNEFVREIKTSVKSTFIKGVMTTQGGFGGLFALDKKAYKDPVMVSSTDGVGTKLIIAQDNGIHDTVGIDLVAMNVNDILCVGAKPLFFLDYIACGKLDKEVLKKVVKGIAHGCRQAGCALIGGETAEMPDMYSPQEYDLAGFTVGVVERKKMIDGARIKEGDVVIGLPSTGIHSNGYSLVRKVFSKEEQKARVKEILMPTKIYVKDVLPVIEKFDVKGIAHITGGAYYEKMTKILPKGLCFEIKKGSWPIPKIFIDMQQKGNVPEADMYKTFNMGIGMVLVVALKSADKVSAFLKQKKVKHYRIGEVVKGGKRFQLV